jgi:hypothetical protein
MLHKCANPACHNLFRRLRDGKLFQIEIKHFAPTRGDGSSASRRNGRHVEHYWLCDACAPLVTLAFDKTEGMIIVPLPGGPGEKVVTVFPQPVSESPSETLPGKRVTSFSQS